MRFFPDTLVVSAGDTIVWVNEDIVAHTATAEAKEFDSGEIKAGTSWKYRANKPGQYSYKCIFHPTMKASITVE
jgi:plastocyanin